MRRFRDSLLMVVMGLVFLTAGMVPAADRIPCERRLPPNVMQFIAIGHFPQFWKRFQQSLAGQMINHSQWGRSTMGSISTEYFTAVLKSVDLTPSKFLELAKGEAALAVVREPPGHVAFVVIVDIGQQQNVILQHKERITSFLSQDKVDQWTTETILGTRCELLDMSKKSPQVRTSETRPGFFMRDSYLVASTSDKTLKAILERWDGRHATTFDNSPEYRTVREKSKIPSIAEDDRLDAIRWYFGRRLDDGMTELFAAIPFGMSVITPVAFLGMPQMPGNAPFMSAGYFGGVLLVDSGEFDLMIRTVVHVEPLDGQHAPIQKVEGTVASLFTGPVDKSFGLSPISDSKVAAWIGSDSNRVWEWKWNLRTAFGGTNPKLQKQFPAEDQIEREFDSNPSRTEAEAILPSMDQIETSLVNVVRELETRLTDRKIDGLVNFLTGRFRLITYSSPAENRDDVHPLLALEIRDAAAEQKVIIALRSERRKSMLIGGVEVWKFPGSAKQPPAVKETGKPGAYLGLLNAGKSLSEATDQHAFENAFIAVAHQHLLLTGDLETLKRVIAPAKKVLPLMDTEHYQVLSRHVPKNRLFLQYRRFDQSDVRFPTWPENAAVATPTKMATSESIEEFLLPFLPPMIGFVEPHDSGICTSVFRLRQSKTRAPAQVKPTNAN